jgi:hypothetical protein
MDEAGAIARATAMRDAGDRAKGIQSLRTRVERNPTELEARRILAEWYRDDGTHDQAGRWGIVFPGWTTTYERDRTARLFAASYPVRGDVRAFLHLPAGTMPADAQLLAARIPVQRELLGRKAHAPDPAVVVEMGPLGRVAAWLAAVGGVVLLALAIVTPVGVLLGSAMTAFVRWGALISGVTLAVAAFLGLVTAFLPGRTPDPEGSDPAGEPEDEQPGGS